MTTTTRSTARLSSIERTALLRAVRERAGVTAAATDDRPRPRPDGQAPPATAVQHQLHYLHEMVPDVPNYTTAFAVELHGPLDPQRLRDAFAASVAAHEALRTQIRRVDGRLVQEIASFVPVEIPVYDCGTMQGTTLDPVKAAWARADEVARTVFDPGRAPLWRAELAVLDERRTHHLLILAASHSVFDGVSMGVLLHDIAGAYRDGQRPSPAIQLGDVAMWEQERLTGPRRAELLGYWRERLEGLRPLAFPLDRPRSRQPVLTGDAVYEPLAAELLDGVDALARAADVTRFTVLLAGYLAVLSGLTGVRDVAVGVPLDGRIRPVLAGVVGSLVNTVVVRCEVEPDTSFRALVDQMRPIVAGAIEHQDLPLGHLVEDLRPARDGAAPPLVQTLFNFAGMPSGGRRYPVTGELSARLHGLSNGAVRFDFEMSVDETHKGLRVRFDYGTAVMERESAERIVATYIRFLRAAVAAPDTALGALPDAVRAEPVAVADAPPATRPEDRRPAASDSPTVGVVASLWAEALDLESTPLDSDFFTLGGSSLLAVSVGERIAERTGVTVGLLDLLTAESVVALAAVIDSSPTSDPRETS